MNLKLLYSQEGRNAEGATIDVVTQVELIGLGEAVSDEELLLLKTAALFHDSGHILGYKNHEMFSTLIAREILPDYYYTQTQIEKICELIFATEMPPNPKNRLEEIMCDADLDSLGREDYLETSHDLHVELVARGASITLKEWYLRQINFLSNHTYFTDVARKLRDAGKQENIRRLKALLQTL